MCNKPGATPQIQLVGRAIIHIYSMLYQNIINVTLGLCVDI